MEETGQITVGKRIARTLEDSREKRRKVKERRGTKGNQLSECEGHRSSRLGKEARRALKKVRGVEDGRRNSKETDEKI
jgi:hypothetical protein